MIGDEAPAALLREQRYGSLHEVETPVRVESEDALPLGGADLRYVRDFDERSGGIHHTDDPLIPFLELCEQSAGGILILQCELPRHELTR